MLTSRCPRRHSSAPAQSPIFARYCDPAAFLRSRRHRERSCLSSFRRIDQRPPRRLCFDRPCVVFERRRADPVTQSSEVLDPSGISEFFRSQKALMDRKQVDWGLGLGQLLNGRENRPVAWQEEIPRHETVHNRAGFWIADHERPENPALGCVTVRQRSLDFRP